MIMLFLAAFDKKKSTKAQGIKLMVMMIEDGKDNEKIEDDTGQVGGQGELDSLRVGRGVDVEEEQDEEDQVEVEIEAPRSITQEHKGDHEHVGKEAELDEQLRDGRQHEFRLCRHLKFLLCGKFRSLNLPLRMSLNSL